MQEVSCDDEKEGFEVDEDYEIVDDDDCDDCEYDNDDDDGDIDADMINDIPNATENEDNTRQLNGSEDDKQETDIEALSLSACSTLDDICPVQPGKSSGDSSKCTDPDEENVVDRSKPFWLRSRWTMACAGLIFVAFVAGLAILIVYLVWKGPSNPSPTLPPVLPDTPAPSQTPSVSSSTLEPTMIPTTSQAPTMTPTTILDTSSTTCQVPENGTGLELFQAENAQLLSENVVISNETSGFCGEGFVTGLSRSDSFFAFESVEVGKTGYYRIALRYANGAATNLPLTLVIDGRKVGEFEMIPTQNWTTWMVEGVDSILLRESKNHTIEVGVPADARNEGPFVDWLSIRLLEPATRFEYLTTLLSSKTDVLTPSQSQISALLWMSTEDPIDWYSMSDREIVERYSLVEFYYSTEGDLWSNNNEWLSAFHVCDWYGVLCSEDKLVTDLILDNNGLFGPIPTDIFLLSNLVSISLKTNSLEGTIADKVSTLDNLTGLFLNANFLTGTIPETIGSLESLLVLDLGANDLTGEIPSALYSLNSLESLILSSNGLQGGLRTTIGKLLKLEELDLQSNSLSGELPTELGLMTSLTSLILGFNNFSGTIPSELGLLSNLLYLDLSK
jgi:Leucine-rich repeat (LRR) protein